MRVRELVVSLEDRAEFEPIKMDKRLLPGNFRFTSFLLLVLTAALVASLVGNLNYFRSREESPEPIHPVRLDLVSEQQFGLENAALVREQPRGVRLVFVGDSDISLWNPLPQVAGAEIIQRGFGGDKSGDLLVRLERDVIELKPAVVVLTIGGND
ncbi:MAG: hypothetical protein JO112_14660, partial [Planctomycetes bacterium]|nr:hypothetical protein [Planctomycetota bacterium]